MGQPAAVSGDQVDAVCSLHLMPNPAPTARTGDSATCCRQPTGTLPGSAATVLIGG